MWNSCKHTLRSNYQAAIWKGSLDRHPDVPSPSTLGWLVDEVDGKEYISIDWMDGDPAPQAVLQLLACKCPRTCKQTECQCILSGLVCTQMCQHNASKCPNLKADDEIETTIVEDTVDSSEDEL